MRGIIRAAAREGGGNNKNKKNGRHEADDVNINSCLAERVAGVSRVCTSSSAREIETRPFVGEIIT